MANINGTNVAAKIVPFTTDDSYATHDETYGVGGYRTVASVTEMNNIPSARRKEGMLVNVTGDKIYKLVNGSFVDASLGGGGALSIIELPSAVAELTSTSTVEQVKAAFGGNSGITSILNNITSGKKYVAGVASTVVGGITADAVLPVIATGISGSNKNLLLLYPTNYYRINLALIDGAISVSLEPVYNASISDDPLNAIQTGAVKSYIDSGGGGGSSMKILTTSNLFVLDRGEDISLNMADTAVLKSMFNNGYKSTQLYYVGAPLGDWGVFPVSIECGSFPSSLSDGDSPWMSITYSSGLPVYEQFVYNEPNDSFDSVNSTAHINNQMTFYTQNTAQNGYVKFHNGTMIQWGKITNAPSGETSITFPVSFASGTNPIATVSQLGGNSNNVYSVTILTLNYRSMRVHRKLINPAGIADTAYDVFYTAIGRWK